MHFMPCHAVISISLTGTQARRGSFHPAPHSHVPWLPNQPHPPNLPFYTLTAYRVSQSGWWRRLNRGCPPPGQPDVDGQWPPGLDLLSCRRLQHSAPWDREPSGSYNDGHQMSLLPHQWPRLPACLSPAGSAHLPTLPKLLLTLSVPFSASRTPGNVFPSRCRALKAQSMMIRPAASSLGSGRPELGPDVLTLPRWGSSSKLVKGDHNNAYLTGVS